MKLSVIIVSYNVKVYLEQCILSVLEAGQGMDFEILIVDNASTDGTIAYLKRHFPKRDFPQLHVLENKENIGFGRANNEALRTARGEYVLFLNPDTLLTDHTLSDCCAFLDGHSEAGVLGVRMLHPDGTFALESRRGLPTPFAAGCKLFGLTKAFPKSKLFGQYYMQYLDEHAVCPIQVVSGAYMMARRATLLEAEGFDDRFFMYGEDIDLSYRITKMGLQNYYLPTPILHYKGESTEKSSFRYVHVFYDAMLIFFNKHFKKSYFLLALPVRLTIYIIALYALIYHTLERWRHWLRPARSEEANYLFIGHKKHFADVRKIAQQWGFNVDCLEGDMQSRPEGHAEASLNAEKYKFAVYDTSCYSISRILQNFETLPGVCLLGTYYPKRRILITNQRTFTL